MTEQTKVLQPHQQRVVDEKAELDVKIEKLTKFLSMVSEYSVPPEEIARLESQLKYMTGYSIILGGRIHAF